MSVYFKVINLNMVCEDLRKFRVSECTDRNLSRNPKIIPKPKLVLARIMLDLASTILIFGQIVQNNDSDREVGKSEKFLKT